MLLSEIFSSREVDQLPQNNFKDVVSDIKARGHNELGSGAHGVVFSKDNVDVDHVEKVCEDNVYIEYVKAIANLHNPYFPQVDVVKALKLNNQTETEIHSVIMERLFPFNHLTIEQLYSIFDKLGIKHVVDKMSTGMAAYNICSTIRDWIEDTRDISPEADEDNHLVAAIELLRKFNSRNNVFLDLHPGNVMVRKTPYGPHLVFTDPFAFDIGVTY